MEFSLPGAPVAEQAWASVPPSAAVGSTKKSSAHAKHKGLHAKVWENVAGVWQVTHNFNMGLELDRDSNSDNRHPSTSRAGAHLPAVSVPALMHLRSALAQPAAIHLGQQEGNINHFDILTKQLSSVLSEQSKEELTSLLGLRSEEVAVAIAGREKKLEDLLRDEQFADHMDISICSLTGFDPARPAAVALARLGGTSKSVTALRWEALVVCPAGDERKSRFACDIGRALATTFMDEGFYNQVDAPNSADPQSVLQALDQYLESMTLVPTVHMVATVPESIDGDTEISETEKEVLLADTIVDGMEKRIFHADRSEGSGSPTPAPGARSESSCTRRGSDAHSACTNWMHYFVEVDQLCEATTQWEVTRRLRQGLELELNSNDTRPHLPHVSLAGLARVRELMGPNSVALDVAAPDPHAATRVAMDRLVAAGLPQAARTQVGEALLDRTINGAFCSTAPNSPMAVHVYSRSRDLIKPCLGEEACVILSMAHSQVPAVGGVMGAFLRLDSPLDILCGALDMPTRFLLVLVGPAGSGEELRSITDSLAALAVDEDLMGNLFQAKSVSAFQGAVEDRLDALILMPHAHLSAPKTQQNLRKIAQQKTAEQKKESSHSKSGEGPEEQCPHVRTRSKDESLPIWKRRMHHFINRLQKYSVPLVSGVLIALVWTNVDEHSYHDMTHGLWFEGDLFGDPVPMSLHFLVNDIFMCFFFGLAIKEVTEAVLPGGCLSPVSRAANPLMATVGGIVGPIAVYMLLITIFDGSDVFEGLQCVVPQSSERRLAGGGSSVTLGDPEPCPTSSLMKGWGVPIATDISLAWMFALLIFGAGHPAINFLLLLAIVDDAIGMAIIAIFYPNPESPVNPVWLLFVFLAVVVAGILRILLTRLNMQFWSIYVFVCGPISWLGLYKAHVHPALALVFVVPFMPATHARLKRDKHDAHLGCVDPGQTGQILDEFAGHISLTRKESIVEKVVQAIKRLEDAPLHTFEHQLKLPVDIGMFFFGLANAGVKFKEFGGITIAVVIALIIGKTLGIAFFALFASAIGFKLPAGVETGDLFAMGALGGIGLTVALFMSNEAFVDNGLRGQAKIGAVLSVTSAAFAWFLRWLFQQSCVKRTVEVLEEEIVGELSKEDDADDAAWMDDVMVEDVIEILRMQRRYQSRGTEMPFELMARSVSKDAQGRRLSKGETSSSPLRNSFREFGNSLRGSFREGSSPVGLAVGRVNSRTNSSPNRLQPPQQQPLQ